MGTVITITTEARCKHCKYLKEEYKVKKDGSNYKRLSSFCGNIQSLRYKEQISKRDLVCNNWDI